MAVAAVSPTEKTERLAARRAARTDRRAAYRMAAVVSPTSASEHIRELLHALHAESGSLITGNSEQLRLLIAHGSPEASPRWNGLVTAVHADIQEHCVVTQDDVARIVKQFNRRMDPGRPLIACASCGVRALDMLCEIVLPLRDLPADHWLRFSSDQRAELQALPDVTLLSSAGDTQSVNLGVLRSDHRDLDGRCAHLFAHSEGARPWSMLCRSQTTARPHDRFCTRGTIHRFRPLR